MKIGAFCLLGTAFARNIFIGEKAAHEVLDHSRSVRQSTNDLLNIGMDLFGQITGGGNAAAGCSTEPCTV